MPNAGFVHLHVHSAYSLLKGSIKIGKLGELAKADRQPALALTDHDGVWGSRELAEACRANEILKAASAFFAAELDRPTTR